MSRYGAMYGPDFTFLGVPACNWREPETYADADVVIIGAPFDGGTSHRPGTRFGPSAIRGTDYLPLDPVEAMRTGQKPFIPSPPCSSRADRRGETEGRR